MNARETATPSSPQRISLEAIDAVVSARLGETRVRGNAQPAVLNRQVAMYLAKHVGGWSPPGSEDSITDGTTQPSVMLCRGSRCFGIPTLISMDCSLP